MKLRTRSESLLAQLATVARVASTRSAVQALSGVAMEATERGAELRATDTEVGLRVALEGDVEREGLTVLPARLLFDVARALPAPEAVLEYRAAEHDVAITSGNASFRLRTLRAEDFPVFPPPPGHEGESTVAVPARAFVDTVGKVARSASRDETRPILTGILVSASGRELRMVATDSYRLSVKETQLDEELSAPLEANVPARALQELARIVGLGDAADELRVAMRRSQVVFEVRGTVLSSRLIEGQFPNYRQLLPESYEHELRLDADEIAGVVRRVSLLAQKNAPLRLAFEEGQLTVSAQTPDIGAASETMPVGFRGEPLEIGFNPEFLRAGLEGVESGELVLKLISPLRPGLIEAADGSGFSYLIMPIRLNV